MCIRDRCNTPDPRDRGCENKLPEPENSWELPFPETTLDLPNPDNILTWATPLNSLDPLTTLRIYLIRLTLGISLIPAIANSLVSPAGVPAQASRTLVWTDPGWSQCSILQVLLQVD